MEGGRKVQLLLGLATVVLLTLSYSVGYYVGKEAGITQEKKICEVEKKEIIKTLSQINPVSRPQTPIEDRVVAQVVGGSSQEQGLTEKVEGAPEKQKEENGNPSGEGVSEKKKEGEKVAEAQAQQPKVARSTETEKAENSSKEKKEKGQLPPASVGSVKEIQKEKGEQKKAEVHGKVYFLQVGVFRSERNAERLAQELRSKGFPAKVEKLGSRYRVVVGDFTDWKEAASVQRKLRQEKIPSILRWRKS
jgi:cell division protein FtsN